jgi:hypothetical protein
MLHALAIFTIVANIVAFFDFWRYVFRKPM